MFPLAVSGGPPVDGPRWDTTGQRVLVVDDEAGIREVLRAYLERGSLVEEAGDGPL